jgi:hypothetical protein
MPLLRPLSFKRPPLRVMNIKFIQREILSKFKLKPLSPLILSLFLVFPLILSQKIVNSQETITGIGIIGDSGSDEYRADDNRAGGTIYASTTLSWVELLEKYRDLNFGAWSDTSRGKPRRKGYEYNWARSGYTSGQMISSGMHTGVAAQIRQGKISYVYMQIGINDFGWWNGNYQAIYDGTLTGVALQNKIDSIINNITLAIDTVKAAGNVKMVVATIGDISLSSYVIAEFPDPVKRQRVSGAISAVNNGIISAARSRNVVVVDSNAILSAMLSRLDANGFLDVGGEKVDTKVSGDEPHHMMLSDNIHAGTVVEGLLQANELFIKTFNANYSTDIPLFTDQEILQDAGIKPPSTPPTPSSTPTISPSLTATPSSTPGKIYLPLISASSNSGLPSGKS